MPTLVKQIEYLTKHYEDLRLSMGTTSNPKVQKLFRTMEKTVSDVISNDYGSRLKIKMKLGTGRLTSTPVLYFLNKAVDAKPSKGLYVALVINNDANKSGKSDYKIALTQGHKALITSLKKDYGLSEGNAKKRAYEYLAQSAIEFADSYYTDLKARGFSVASTDDLNNNAIAEKNFKLADNIDDSQLYQAIRHLLDIYFNITASDSEQGTKIDRYVSQQVLSRKGQPEFRRKLFATYGVSCMITDCKVLAAIEAAHIVSHSEKQNYSINNGLLLRADLHVLYDQYLIGIDGKGTIFANPDITGAGYLDLDGKKINCNISDEMRNNLEIEFRKFSRAHDFD